MDYINCSINPWEILGVSREADDITIEEAWRKLTSQRRSDDMINLAYRMIATGESRAQWELLSPGRQESLDSIIKGIPLRPKYSGPGIWYKTLDDVLQKNEIDS